jgi:hypothetical protein
MTTYKVESSSKCNDINDACRVYLRVRRRVDVPVINSLRLEGIREIANDNVGGLTSCKNRVLEDQFQSIGINNNDDNNIDDNIGDDNVEVINKAIDDECHLMQQRLTTRRPALWKLVTSTLQNNIDIKKDSKETKKRVVTAILEAVYDDDNQNPYDNNTITKRRKLDIVHDTTTDVSLMSLLVPQDDSKMTASKRKGLKILHPLERMVDDSLQQVFRGERTIQQHVDLILNDPNLQGAGNIKWWIWCNVEYGNLLHACSIWNNVIMTNEILSRLSQARNDKDDDYICVASSARDTSGQTPYDVARLSGHHEVCNVLESYGYSKIMADSDNNFEYDLYCLQENDDNDEFMISENDDNASSNAIACELRTGQTGYWNEEGELVLELFQDGEVSNSDLKSDEDDDSNRESFEGNDYPDDEGTDDDGILWPPTDDSDDDGYENCVDQTYRNRPVVRSSYSYDSQDEATNGIHDASYGIFSSNAEQYDSEC